jgi:CS domain
MGIKEMEPDKSIAVQRNPEIRISQTNTLVLISILEPNVSEDDIYVVIEPKHISVEITRRNLENPLIAGILFGQVEKDHCRVRIKKDSVLIKLRKTDNGRWRSILQDMSALPQKPTPETRIRPVQGTKDKDPIEPSPHHDLPGDSEQSAIPVDMYEVDDKVETIDASESKVFSTLESIKKFHKNLFGGVFGSSFAVQEEGSEETDDESRNEVDITDGTWGRLTPIET